MFTFGAGGEGGVLGFLRFEGLHHDIPFGGYLCAKDLLALDPWEQVHPSTSPTRYFPAIARPPRLCR